MNKPADQAITGGEEFSAREPVGQFVRSNDKLREELQQLRQRNVELLGHLDDATARSRSERDSRRAALNLMEDAVHARRAEQRENTERREVELALRKSEERYRCLFESIDEGFCLIELVLDAGDKPIAYRILEMNLAFERHSGIAVTTPPVTMPVVGTENEPGDGDVCCRIVLADQNRRFEVCLQTQNRWLEVHASPISDGGISLVAAVSNDITDRKAAEEQLRNLNASLEQRVEERTKELRQNEGALRTAATTARRSADRLRELATQLASSEQRTRHHLSQILHEHVQQLLVAARLRIELVNDTGMNQETASQLEGAVTMLNTSIEAIRTLSVELAPPLLHDQGLPAALTWLAPRMETQHGLVVDLCVDEQANPVTEEDRNILFHAARELLLNVVKHSRTKAARLLLSASNGQIRLEVSDRGAGFDRRNLENGVTSFGLFQLRHQFEAIDGSLTVTTSPGAGTSVAAVLASRESESGFANRKLSGKPAARRKRTRSGPFSKPNGRSKKTRPKSRKRCSAEDGERGEM